MATTITPPASITSTVTAPGQIKSTLTIGQGPAGPGAGGPGGSGDKTYVHPQSIAAAQWVVPHNLDKFPSVTVIDSAGDECDGNIVYNDSNSLTLVFSAAFAGVAYLN